MKLSIRAGFLMGMVLCVSSCHHPGECQVQLLPLCLWAQNRQHARVGSSVGVGTPELSHCTNFLRLL